MKKNHATSLSIILLIIFAICTNIYSIEIHYKNSSERDILHQTKVDGTNYYKISEIRQVFKTGNHFIDFEYNQLNFTIFNQSVILYLHTNFATIGGKLCNLSYPTLQRENDYMVPATFLTRILPTEFPQNIEYNSQRNILIAEKQSDRRIRTIVIDPGHGGRDPGAVGKSHYEKNIVLEIARKLKTKLEREIDVRVLLTRSTDAAVSLQDRTTYANQNKADLFISLHCNGSQAKTANGIEVFILSPARTNYEREIEEKENAPFYNEDMPVGDVLGAILEDLEDSVRKEESSDLAIRLQTQLIQQTRAADRGIKQAGFYVLRGVTMPSVLIELGFITNEEEERKLASSEHQEKLITAVVNAIISFKAKYDDAGSV